MPLTSEEVSRIEQIVGHAAKGAVNTVLLNERVQDMIAGRIAERITIPSSGNRFRIKLPAIGEIDFSGKDVMSGIVVLMLGVALAAALYLGRQDVVALRDAQVTRDGRLDQIAREWESRHAELSRQHAEQADGLRSIVYVLVADDTKKKDLLRRMDEPYFLRQR